MKTNEFNEREWQAQERALRDAREGLASTDPQALRYRKVADALRMPLPDALPADFASSVAALAEHNARAPVPALVQAAQSGVLERGLLRAAIAVMGVGSAVVVAMYGAQWAPAFSSLWPAMSGSSAGWATLLVACLGVSLGAQGMARALRAAVPTPA